MSTSGRIAVAVVAGAGLALTACDGGAAPIASGALASTDDVAELFAEFADAHPECDAGWRVETVFSVYVPRGCAAPSWVGDFSNVEAVPVDYSYAEATEAYEGVKAAIDDAFGLDRAFPASWEVERNAWVISASPEDVSAVQGIIDSLATEWEAQRGLPFPVAVVEGTETPTSF